MNTQTFHHGLMRRIASDLSCFQRGNVDKLRFPDLGTPWGSKMRSSLLNWADGFLGRFGYVRHNDYRRAQTEMVLAQIESHSDGFEWLFNRLSDAQSRQTLIEVMAYWALGPRHTKLSCNNKCFWKAVEELQTKAIAKAHVAPVEMLDGWLDDYALDACGFDVRLRAHKLNVLNTFLLEQYRFIPPAGPEIGVRKGDVVLDGGGCWGDTTLYFAHATGESGQVHVFEFAPGNLKVLRENLNQNPKLAPLIQIHEKAVWDVSGDTLHFGEAGPATSLTSKSEGPLTAQTLSIDDWFRESKTRSVDFIKLDIEGAEAQALTGAQDTITNHKPTLAVALYHSLEDFVKLPKIIDQMLPEYRFHLGHYTIHREETILFATAR